MLKTLLVLFNAAALLLAATAPAHAGPIIAGVAAFMASPLGQLVVGVGAMLISGVVKGLFGSKQAQRVNGTQLSKRFGGDGPFSFPLGPAGTAGTVFYFGSWGDGAEAPNAYHVEAVSISDLPIAGWKGFWVNDQRAELGSYDATLGYPVLDFRRGGKDHVWIKPYDGTQTAPDAYLRAKFGSHPVYPYDADMVGKGVAYIIVTTRRPGPDHQDLLSSPARVLAEPDSILQYDLRKDTTAGGSGPHRWGVYSTYEASSNLMVQAYNVARGISYDGEWVFGGQNWPGFRLPVSSWMAAMNACDLAIPLAGGGTEPQFHGGGMVEVSEVDAVSLLNELLKSASAKIAEAGGVYKVRVGAPGIPVMHFTDEDIVVTREHGWTPFRGIGETFNTVNWTYSEPQARWTSNPGPQYKDSALVASDRGRTLPMSFEVPWTQSNTTGQRLVQAALKNSRRMDMHVMSMPPIAWLLEALDTVSWSSVQAGYEAKEFELDELSGNGDLIQFVSLRENDPSDYGWTPETDQRPYAIAPMLTIRPAPQEVSGPSVAPVPGTLAYDVFWSGPSVAVDVQFVRVSHQRPDGTLPYTVLVPKPDLLTGAARIPVSVELSGKPIEVQLEYLPYSGRPTVASTWMPVTIADVKLPPGMVDLSNVAKDVLDQMGLKPRALIEQFKQLGTLLEEVDRENYTKREALFREISVELEGLEASFTEVIEVALGPGGAIAQRIDSLYAAMGGSSAEINVSWKAIAAPAGVSARYALQALALDGTGRTATFLVDVPQDPLKPTLIGFMAGQTAFFTSGGAPIGLVDEDGFFRSANDAVVINMFNGDFSFGL